MYDLEFTETAVNTLLLLQQAYTAANRAAEISLAKIGLSPEKAAVLWAARDYPGPLTPAELSRLAFRKNQSIAGLLNRMEREGLVRRIPKRRGRPFTEVILTEAGSKACPQAIAILKELITTLCSDLTKKDQVSLCGILQKVRDRALSDMYMEKIPPPNCLQKPSIPLDW